MIIKNICLLLEVLSIVIFLCHLYGEKFKLDIVTICLLAVDMLMMQIIDFLGMSDIISILIYPIIAVYCGIKFGFKFKSMIVNIVLCIIVIGGIQVLVSLPMCYLLDLHNVMEIELLIVTMSMFFIVIFGLPMAKIKKLSTFLQSKEKIFFMTLMMCMGIILFWLVGYKKTDRMEFEHSLILFVCIIFILVLAMQLMKYKMKVKEAEIELKMHQVYSEPFQALIDNIRLRQHEFDNHINAIYSQHFSYCTYEELVEAQRKYCEHIVRDNRFNRLLSKNNSVIGGFLYARFIEIDKKGIEIGYRITFDETKIKMPIYRLIEILGDLINNAIEALEKDKERNGLYVAIIEADYFQLEVRNESPYIEYNEINSFFNNGYSKKGENRGLGLYNVKQICNEYRFEIFCENIEIDKRNWISFKVRK